jgi:hypothetical protein
MKTVDDSRTGAVLERSFSLVNHAMFAIALQHRRYLGDEPEDEHFLFRKWTDFLFFLNALQRMRLAAGMVPEAARSPRKKHPAVIPPGEDGVEVLVTEIDDLLKAFDERLPRLQLFRNVAEHLDEYVLGRGNDTSVHTGQTQVMQLGTAEVCWVGSEGNNTFDINEARAAAEALFTGMRDVKNRWVASRPK